MLSRMKQSTVTPVKVDIETFIERSQLCTYMITTLFHRSLTYYLIVFKLKGNIDIRQNNGKKVIWKIMKNFLNYTGSSITRVTKVFNEK